MHSNKIGNKITSKMR